MAGDRIAGAVACARRARAVQRADDAFAQQPMTAVHALPRDDARPLGLASPASPVAGRDRLLGGLASVIDDVGYPAVRIRDISSAARASLSTFYQEFPSKEACLIALAERLEEPVLAWFGAGVGAGGGDRATGSGDATVETLEVRLAEALQLAAARPRLASALLLELGATGTPGGLRARRRVREVLAEALRCAASSPGQAGAMPPPERALFVVGGLVEGLALALPAAGDALGPPDHAALAALASVGAGLLLAEVPGGPAALRRSG